MFGVLLHINGQTCGQLWLFASCKHVPFKQSFVRRAVGLLVEWLMLSYLVIPVCLNTAIVGRYWGKWKGAVHICVWGNSIRSSSVLPRFSKGQGAI